MNRDYQAIKRSYGREIHAAGPDGKPACGTEPGLRWFLTYAREADCHPCLMAASADYAHGYADGYAVHLGLGIYDADRWPSATYRDAAQKGRTQAVDDHLTQLAEAGELTVEKRPHPRRVRDLQEGKAQVRRGHANCPSCKAQA